MRCIRYKQSGPYERFFRTFKNELVPGLLLTLLWGAGRRARAVDARAAAAVQRRSPHRHGCGRGVLCRADPASRRGMLGVSDPLTLCDELRRAEQNSAEIGRGASAVNRGARADDG